MEDICSNSCQWNSRTQPTLVCHLASLPGFAKPCRYNSSWNNCCWASWYVLEKWSEGAYTKRELAVGALDLKRGDEERTDGPTGYRYARRREMVDSLFEMDNSSRSGTYNVVLEVPKLDEIWVNRIAEHVLFRIIQKECFPEEFRSLTTNHKVQRDSKLIQFRPFWDDGGLIRASRRLQLSDLEEDTKHPVIMADHVLTGFAFLVHSRE